MKLFWRKRIPAYKKRIVSFWRKISLTRRIIYTFFLLVIFIAAGTFTAPGVKLNDNPLSSNSFLDILNLVGGGGLRNFSVVALGISPFITASLIMQVLQTKFFPPIYQLAQSGPIGRRKINLITRLLTIFLAYTQSISIINLLRNVTGFGVTISDSVNGASFVYFLLPLILIGGSLFTLFLAEQITNNGVGNGVSLIIYTGIALTMPTKFLYAYRFLVGSAEDYTKGLMDFFVYSSVFLTLILIVSFVFKSERRVPIQQVGAGLSRSQEQLSWLPIKANPAGIMPLIFASIVLSLPFLLSGLLNQHTSLFRAWVEKNLSLNAPLGFSLFILLTILLSLFMGIQQTRIDRIIEDFNRSSTFIPGLRPGETTENYLISLVLRLSFFSAIYLTFIGSFNYIEYLIGLPHYISFGGTSVVILITSSLETVSQIGARRRANQLVILRSRINSLNRLTLKSEQERDLNQAESDLLW